MYISSTTSFGRSLFRTEYILEFLTSATKTKNVARHNNCFLLEAARIFKKVDARNLKDELNWK